LYTILTVAHYGLEEITEEDEQGPALVVFSEFEVALNELKKQEI